MELAIQLKKLTKIYPGTTHKAVDGLDLVINTGEVYGLLGPNGAGKTTVIRTLMGFINSSAGSFEILGQIGGPANIQIKHDIGYLPSDMEFYPHMSGKQFLGYMQSLQSSHDNKYFDYLVKKFDVDLHKKLEELSRGNRQKVAIIQALMARPKVLILDEPTSGLDPLMQEVFYEEILSAKDRGATVLLSSHILAEVQKICDRVGIIKAGKMIAERNVDELLKSTSQTFMINFESHVPIAELKKLKGLKITESTKNSVSLTYQGDLSQLLGLLAKQKVTSLHTKTLDLEEIFLGFYENEVNK